MGGNGNGASPTARLVFTGDQITYFYGVSELGGTADVFIGGELKATVSFDGDAPSNDPRFGESITFDGLGDGEHELLIEHRQGAVYVDGFRIASGAESGSGAAADESAPRTRSVTEVSVHESGTLTQLTREIDLPASDESVSVLVEAGDIAPSATLVDPLGNIVAAGELAIDGAAITGFDSAVDSDGTYTLIVGLPLGETAPVEISVARTVPVR